MIWISQVSPTLQNALEDWTRLYYVAKYGNDHIILLVVWFRITKWTVKIKMPCCILTIYLMIFFFFVEIYLMTYSIVELATSSELNLIFYEWLALI